jgi:hypothetical protein
MAARPKHEPLTDEQSVFYRRGAEDAIASFLGEWERQAGRVGLHSSVADRAIDKLIRACAMHGRQTEHDRWR